MAQSERGLYETLVTEAMDARLAALDGRLQARRSELHEAEAADRIALHLARVIERALGSLDKGERGEGWDAAGAGAGGPYRGGNGGAGAFE